MSTVVTLFLYNSNQINSVIWLLEQLGVSAVYWGVTRAEIVDGSVVTRSGTAVQLVPSESVDVGTFLGTTLPEKLSLWEFGVQGSSSIQVKVETEGISELWDIESINDFSLFTTVYAGFSLVASDPINDVENVKASHTVVLTFSRPIDTFGITLGDYIYITEKDSEVALSATVEVADVEGAVDGTVVHVTPDADLTFGTEYTVHYSVADKSYEKETSGSFDFTVVDELTLVSAAPADTASNVGRSADAVLTFSIPVSLGDTGSVSLVAGGTPVIGDVVIANAVATFTPDEPLAYNTAYSIEYTVYDGYDEEQTLTGVSGFTTIAEPALLSSDPAHESVDHPITDPLVLTFNMDVSIGTGSVTLLLGENTVATTVEVVGSVVTVTPDSMLNGSVYTLQWSITDAFSAGEEIVGSITFTTAEA